MHVYLMHATVLIDPVAGLVETRFPDGVAVVAVRPDTDQNRQEAADQGYPASAAGVFESLWQHELLHSLVAEWLWNKPSPTLRHVGGGTPVPYGKQLYEEAVVIAFQRYLTTRDVWDVLEPFRDRLDHWLLQFKAYA